MKLKTLIESGDPEQLATGFQFTEGPVWQADGSLLFSDIPANRTYRWTAQSRRGGLARADGQRQRPDPGPRGSSAGLRT